MLADPTAADPSLGSGSVNLGAFPDNVLAEIYLEKWEGGLLRRQVDSTNELPACPPSVHVVQRIRGVLQPVTAAGQEPMMYRAGGSIDARPCKAKPQTDDVASCFGRT